MCHRGALLVVFACALQLGSERTEALRLGGYRCRTPSRGSRRDPTACCSPGATPEENMCNNRPSSNSSSNGNGRDLHRIGNLYFPPVQRAPMQWGSDYVRQHARNLSNKQYREQIILPIKQWIPSTKIPRSAYGRTGVLEHALDPKTSGRGEPEMVAPLPHVAGAGSDKRLGRPVTAARTSGELLHRQRRSCRKTRRVSSRGSGQGPRLWRSIFGVRPPLKEVNSIDDLFCFVDERGWGLEDLSVVTRRGDRAPATDPTRAGDCMVDVSAALHPTVRAVLERAEKGTVPSEHGDGRRIGLAIEVVEQIRL